MIFGPHFRLVGTFLRFVGIFAFRYAQESNRGLVIRLTACYQATYLARGITGKDIAIIEII